MKNQLRSLLSGFKSDPYVRQTSRVFRERGYDRILTEIGTAASYRVLSGPYRGMKYFAEGEIPEVDKVPATKLIGSFEEEIHPWLEEVMGRDFRTVVHIGASDGYHAVGMARRMSRSQLVVFDTLIASRHACAALAEQNDVRSRIKLWGFCGPQSLKEVELEGSFVFSDCGGAELTLLDPIVYPGLQAATILVETHDTFDERITTRLTTRFTDTHRVVPVVAAERDPARYTLPVDIERDALETALDERRKVTKSGKVKTWMMLTPRSG